MTDLPEIRAHALTVMALHWLRTVYPDALLTTELNIGNWGSAMLDVAAVTDDEIIGVEIKGDGDSPSRLERQGWTYPLVATRMWLLPSPSLEARCWKRRPHGWGQLVVRGSRVGWLRGEGGVSLAEDVVFDAVSESFGRHIFEGAPRLNHNSPGAMLNVMWAYELRLLYGPGSSRMACDDMRRAMHDKLSAGEARRFLCKCLLSREWDRKPIYRPGDVLPPLPAEDVREAAE